MGYDWGMPVYEYVCGSCESSVVVSHGMSDAPPPCLCGGVLVKVFGLGGVSFSGSGFYSTDK